MNILNEKNICVHCSTFWRGLHYQMEISIGSSDGDTESRFVHLCVSVHVGKVCVCVLYL